MRRNGTTRFGNTSAWWLAGLCVVLGSWGLVSGSTEPIGGGIGAATAAGHADLRPFSERYADLGKSQPPSFRRHVVPLMSRLGCSGRECHGSFQGRGGFRLSLFGYDFDADHKAIAEDATGGEGEVRVNLKNPAQSLILLKPTMQMKHKGKKRFEKDGWEYNLLLKWVQDGAKNDAKETGEFDRLEVQPAEVLFKKPGAEAQIRVLAHWKDGTVEDVTQLTRFRSNDEAVADVSATGLVTAKETGDTHIVAFYDNGVTPVTAILPVSDRVGDRYPKIAARTRVDELILQKLRKVGIVPSDVCTDAEFLRRVSLDVTGTLPTPDEVAAFLADTDPAKRDKLIDRLLSSPAYAAWWTTRLCDYTGNNRQINDGVAGGLGRVPAGTLSRQWYDWVYKRVASNTPYDQIAAGIVLATGRSTPDQKYEDYIKEMGSYFRKDSPADFADRPTMPYFWQRRNAQKVEEKALAFAHTFLGVRIECAQCHKHPFDVWTKSDFEQFQLFFTPIAFGPRTLPVDGEVNYKSLLKEVEAKAEGEVPLLDQLDEKVKRQKLRRAEEKEVIRRREAGEPVPWSELYVDAKRLGRPAKNRKGKKVDGGSRVLTPKLLGGEQIVMQDFADPRQPLMDWLRDKANPYFARVFVNRVWAGYFGRGLVEPADDLNLANPPSNAAVLDYLTQGFIDHGFDMKWLHREIVRSDAYQRSWRPNLTNEHDEKNFSHFVLRRLPAEVALDAVDMASSSGDRVAQFASHVEDRAIGPAGNATGNRGKRNESYALNLFGRPSRESNCDCERSADPTLLQTIYLRNDPQLLGELESQSRDRTAWIAELRKEYKNTQTIPDSVIRDVFLRTVSRPPTEEELTHARSDVAAAKDPVTGVRDLLWVMLNTREFLVNH